MLGRAKWRIEVVIWHQNGQCPLGWLAKTCLPNLWPPPWTWQTGGGGSSLERQRWVPLRRLSPPLMGQLAWEECCGRTWPGKQKTAFQTLCTDSSASLTYGATVTCASRPGRLAGASWKFLFCDEMMIMMLRYRRWGSRPAHLRHACIGEAYPDTCFQLAGLLHVNAS